MGYGAFWGEVQSAVHKALGCVGVITDGSIRDIPQWAPGFQALAGSIGPSHAWVHAESFGGEVRVAGMTVRSGDLIHADRHGAVVIPFDVAAKLPDAAEAEGSFGSLGRNSLTALVCAYSIRKTGTHPRIKSEGVLLRNTRRSASR